MLRRPRIIKEKRMEHKTNQSKARKGKVLFLALILICCGGSALFGQEASNWKALLVSGSYSEDGNTILNWDRARSGVHHHLTQAGVPPENIRILSSNAQYLGTERQGVQIQPADPRNLRVALESLEFSPGDRAFLFLTSHGGHNQGFYLELPGRDGEMLSVEQLSELLDEYLAGIPTVILISACYSGQFIQGEDPRYSHYDPGVSLQAPGRVILTAARNDRSSFGCGSGSRVPEWDESFLKALQNVQQDWGWKDVATYIQNDIDEKERTYAPSDRSLPQYWVPASADKDLREILNLLSQG